MKIYSIYGEELLTQSEEEMMELENIQGKIFIQELEMRKTTSFVDFKTQQEEDNLMGDGIVGQISRWLIYDEWSRIYGTRNTKTEEIEEEIQYSMHNYNGWWR